MYFQSSQFKKSHNLKSDCAVTLFVNCFERVFLRGKKLRTFSIVKLYELCRGTSVCKQKYAAYFHVSTQQQGARGVSLLAQSTGVISHIYNKGEFIAEFTDIELGKINNRPELLKAITHCKGGVLPTAELDRLTLKVAFVFTLRDPGVNLSAQVCASILESWPLWPITSEKSSTSELVKL